MAESTGAKEVGQRIQTACKEIGWTQVQLAKASKITPASISQFVNGERTPSTPLLRKIAAALNVTVDYLLTGAEGRAKPAETRAAEVFYRDFKSLNEREQKMIKQQIEILKEKSK